MNNEHTNPKYLPGIKLPNNLIAETDLLKVIKFGDILFFALPHQYLVDIIEKVTKHIKPNAKAVSLMKVLSVESLNFLQLS